MTHETPHTPPEPEQYEPYDYNQYTGFSPLGAEALMEEQRSLEAGAEAPKKIGAFTKAFVEHDPSVTEAEVAERLKGPRVSPEGDDKLLRLELEARTARNYLEAGGRYSHRELEKVRDSLRSLDGARLARLETNFSHALSADEETAASELFYRWNKTENGSMLWTDWLQTDPSDGGATDEQLKNVLQWNEYQFRKINRDPRTLEHLHLQELCYEDGLARAVSAGELSPELLKNYREQPKPPVVITDPLSLAALDSHGYIFEAYRADSVQGRSIILEQYWSSSTYAHERTHTLGRITDDRITNEALTDMTTRKIYERSPMAAVEPYDHSYSSEEDILDAYMNFAAIGVYEGSEYYAKRDTEGFMQRLDQGTSRGYIHSRDGLFNHIRSVAKQQGINPSERILLNLAAAELQKHI